MRNHCALGRATDAPGKYVKPRNTRVGGYDKGIFGKKSKSPKTKLRKQAKRP